MISTEHLESPILRAESLSVSYRYENTMARVVDTVSLELYPRRVLGVIGESGSGKSQFLMALTGLNAQVATLNGQVWFGDIELLSEELQCQAVRGSQIAYVFQDPMSALNPYLRIGTQLCEAVRSHEKLSRRAATLRGLDMLDKVQLKNTQQLMKQYPHELSGGMRQRVVIAMALMNRPRVLLADEPTTALDVTVQRQVLDLLRDLCDSESLALAIITHDMSVIAHMADYAAVMYAGRIVEYGTARQVLRGPRHPYTWKLLQSTPDLNRPLDQSLPGIAGHPPQPSQHLDGCRFAPRCAAAQERCHAERPELEIQFRTGVGSQVPHLAACHFPQAG
jgi:oligopeptide/dipeptide ABC transporter ATP-binding protein